MSDNNHSLSVRASTCSSTATCKLRRWSLLFRSRLKLHRCFRHFSFLRLSEAVKVAAECEEQKIVTQQIAHLWKWSESKLINRVQSTETARQLLAGDKALSAGFRWMNSPLVLIQQKNKFYDFIIYWGKKKEGDAEKPVEVFESHRWCRDSTRRTSAVARYSNETRSRRTPDTRAHSNL